MISGFRQKLGFWTKEVITTWKSKSNWIWFHAVSVGELIAVLPLVKEVSDKKTVYPIMISCTTNAGYNLAKEKTKNKNILVFYFPFDLPITINSLLNYAKVKLLIIAETEIWPITLSICKRKNIPVILVNARLSDRSFKNYFLLKFYFKNIVNLFTKVLAQSKTDTSKFIKLGIDNNKIETIGNMKFACFSNNGNMALNKEWHIDIDNEKISTEKLIFASTHPGEDEIAINTFKDLRKDFPTLRLIIAPRHIDRVDSIATLIKKNGFNPIFRSKTQKINSANDIFLLDTIGELASFYSICKMTILCGSFVKIGGHNILEPIKANSYTIIGPYDFKISDLSNLFKEKEAIIQVNNVLDLKTKIIEGLKNTELIGITIKRGQNIIKENGNILPQITKHIFEYLP